MMKTKLFLIVFLLLVSGVFLPRTFASSPGIIYPEPPRALPEGAKMRIGRGQVTDFAFSQDSAQLAVACSIIGIWIYDVHTGNERMLLTGHTDAVTSVVYSPDGTTLASGSYDQTVRLWNAQTYEHRVTLIGHIGNTKALAFSPNGATLASGASIPTSQRIDQQTEEVDEPEEIDSFIRLWGVATGQRMMTLAGHTGWITDLTFSPDGATLASASTDSTLRLWDAATGKHKMTLKGHTDQVVSVVFSPDSTRLISWSADETVRLWDAHTGEQKAVIEGCRYGAVAFSPDGTTLASSQGINIATIRLWDAHTGEQESVLEAQLGRIFSVVFSPDGSKLVSVGGGGDTAIRWWDPNSDIFQAPLKVDSPEVYLAQQAQQRLESKTMKREDQIPSLVFSPDGAMLAEQIHNKIQLWDAHTGEQKAKIEYPDFSSRGIVPSYGVNTRWRPSGRAFVAFSSDATTLACGDGTAKIWLFDPNTGKYRATLNGHTDVIYAVAFSPDGTMLASASEDNTVRVWDTNTGKHRTTLIGHTDAVYPLAFSANGEMLASGSWDRTVRLWNVQTGEERRVLTEHGEAVSAVAFTDDGETLLSLSGREIRLWDVHTGKQRFALRDTFSMALSPDTGTLVGGGRWEIQLWNGRTGQHKGTLTGHLDSTSLLAFSPDGTMLASAGKTIQLWDVDISKNRATFIDNRENSTSHYYNPGDIWSLAFSSDGTLLAGGIGDTIELWDTSLHQHKATLRGHGPPVTSIAFAPQGAMFASASYDGTVVLWNPVQSVDTNTIAKITPTQVVSPALGKELTFNIEITGAETVAGYQLTVAFDETTLQYVSSTNGDYLTDNAFFGQPIVKKNQVKLVSTARTGMSSGDGVLATVTFEVIHVKPSPPRLTNLILSDAEGKRSRPFLESGRVETK